MSNGGTARQVTVHPHPAPAPASGARRGGPSSTVAPMGRPDSHVLAGPAVSAPRRAPVLRGHLPAVAVVSLGGGLGAAGRYGASLLWPTGAAEFPWTTLAVNALGCAVIGVFMVVITEFQPAHRLVRPFFGTGVLGGFTTFSTYAVDVERLVRRHEAPTALAYLTATVVAALLCVWAASAATRRLMRSVQEHGARSDRRSTR